MKILRSIVVSLVLVLLLGCSTIKENLANIGLVETTITEDKESGTITVSSKSDALVEWEYSVSPEGVVTKKIKVNNQGRPGITERLLETALNRTEIIVGSGERTNDKDD